MTKRETYISRQAKRLSKGQIDRRRFVMSALATGVTMPTAMSLASRAEAMVPKRGGLFRFGVADAYDPASATSGMSRTRNLAQCDGLVDLMPDGTVIPALAKRFGSDDGGWTWEFELRAGVQFHSGAPVTAGDVIASFRHAARHSPATRGALSEIKDIRSDSPARLILHLHHPHRRFPELLAAPELIIRPAIDGRIDPTTPDGTGAYRLAHFQPGRSAELVRNENDWRRDRGFFERVELFAMPDAALRQSAMMNGEVDAIDSVDPRVSALLTSLPDIEILEVRGATHLAFTMPLSHPIFADPHLRKALKAAVDREDMLDTGFLGHGTLAGDTPGFDCTDVPAFDVERAAWHHRAARHQGPIPLTLDRSAPPAVTLAADLFRTSAQAAGIEIAVQSAVETAYPQGMTARMRRGMPSEDAGYAATYMPGAGLCETGWSCAPEAEPFQSAVRAARASDDGASSYAMARSLLAENGAEILPLHANDLFAHSTRLAVEATSIKDSASLLLRGWYK